MKILYHHRTASSDGQAVHIHELIGALRALGHEVRVVGPPAADGPSKMGDRIDWVHRLRARLPKALYELLELAYSLVAYRRLAKAAAVFVPDVIYERYNLYLLSGLMLKRRRRIALLLEVNAPLAEERARFGGLGLPRLAAWAERLVWRGADVVLPVTQVLADHVSARGVPAERISVIPNGINEAHFKAAPTAAEAKTALGWNDSLVLGFTGFVRDWHGVDRVIRWLAGPEAPANARLLIVGDGPARASLESLAAELSLRDRVRFTGVVARDQVPRLLAAFDIALQPAAVPYASPLKLFEYMALGKAVIAPRQPNIEEVLTHDRNALLFDTTGSGALERGLAQLCQDPALRRRLGEGAYATIGRLGLTWQSNARRIGALAATTSAAREQSTAKLPPSRARVQGESRRH